MWAMLGAIFLAVTSILAKLGLGQVQSNLATAIIATVATAFSWLSVFASKQHLGIPEVSRRSMMFLAFSGLATGLSWMFYYAAMKMGDASKVVPIDKLSLVIVLILSSVVLHESFTKVSVAGAVLMVVGTLMIAIG